MKKMLFFVLVFAICLSLCACGKSEEVKAVEEKIASIGEVTIEKADTIQEANRAYDALNDKDKEKVENLDILQQSIESLHTETFISLTERCTEMNVASSILADGVIIVWENVGGSRFWNYFDDVLRFTDLSTIDSLKLQNELSAVQMLMWNTGYAMEKESFEIGKDKDGYHWDLTDDDFVYIANLCMPYAKAYDALSKTEPSLNSDVTQFVKDNKDTYPEEANLLREWMLESSMFAEFAMEPAGKLDDYKTKLGDYETMMSRFQKEAEMLK
ncbi:MAG: hypothetical protein IJN20_00910 [Oscillospiraceae bacterium]|nr:hypothetical protein [Oscillospiraceae bacterium]